MTEPGIPANETDVEALVLGDTFANEDESCLTDAVGREVSMRGDIQQMPLADVFQSLGMSKMEGVLRVKNLVETREIYFRDGLVRSYITLRTELRRIGVQLVQGGLVPAETLRAILFEQRKSRRPLRDLLIEHRILPEQDIDALFEHRAAEDLYSLFTWQQGTFEFYKGAPTDPVVVARFDELQQFDINAVLMEVARRSDEWEIILDTIRSTDELVVAVDGAQIDDPTTDLEDVMRALDGRRTIRMLAPSMLFGLFELSRILRDLIDRGAARFATVPEALDAAREFLSHDRKKLATALMETIAARPEQHSYADLHAIAALFKDAGEAKRAASTLLVAATATEDALSALEMLRDARALVPRSCEVLHLLRECLLRLDDPERFEELTQVTDDYCNALIEDGRLDEGLELIDVLEELTPGDVRLAFRRAIVLHKLGRRDEAIAGLLRLAETFKQERQRDQLVVVYEQILKIDPRRRDVSRSLRSLQASRLAKQVRAGAIGVVIAGVALAGIMAFRSHSASKAFRQIQSQVASSLQAGELAEATRMVTEAEADGVSGSNLDSLRAMVESHETRIKEDIARQVAERRRQKLSEAAQHFAQSQFETAMEIYANLMAQTPEASKQEFRDVVRARFVSLLPVFERLAQELPYAVPQAPSPTLDSKARRQVIDDLQRQFQDSDLQRARACLRASEHQLFRSTIDADTATRINKACNEIVRAFGLADLRRTAYQSLEVSAEVGRRLHPLVIQAREHEANHRFKEAAAIYSQLVREHAREDDLRADFRRRAAHAEQLAQGIAAIGEATRRGDSETGWRVLRELESQFPDLPLARLVRVPLSIESRPPGAQVLIGNQVVGKTPLVVAYEPNQTTTIHVDLDGYEREVLHVRGNERGTLKATLTRRPDWSHTAPGAITQSATITDGNLAVCVDRTGQVFGLRLSSGELAWQVTTDDLSGLLMQPAVIDKTVFIASVDGTLRALHASSGKPRWSRNDLATETAPVVVDGTLFLATREGRVHAINPENGSTIFTAKLGAAPTGTLACDGRVIVAVTSGGDLVALDSRDGGERWRRALGKVSPGEPALADNLALVASEEGIVYAFDLADGKPRWSTRLADLTANAPVAFGASLFIAGNDQLHRLNLRSGKVDKSVPIGEPITTLARSNNRILVGTARGSVLCVTPDTGEPTHRMRGPGCASARPTAAADWIVVGFEGKAVQAYRAHR